MRYAYQDKLSQEEIDYILSLANNGYDSDILNAVRYSFGDYDISIERMKEVIKMNLDYLEMWEVFEND